MGYAGAGTSTAAAILAERYGYQHIAIADPLKDMALTVDPVIYWDGSGLVRLSQVVKWHGWERAKERPEVRRYLQRLTAGVRDHISPHTLIALATRRILDAWRHGVPVVLSDVRFPNEVSFARTAGCRLVWIHRPGVTDHATEQGVTPCMADTIVDNDGSLEDLAASLGAIVAG